MKTIVALTDFSDVSLNAVNYAADMAVAMKADLSLLHVCLMPLIVSEVTFPSTVIDDLEKDAIEKLRNMKYALEKRTKAGITIKAEIRIGSFLTETVEYCDSVKPEFIVLGTHETSSLSNFFAGSNTTSAVKHLPWSLVMVPKHGVFTGIKKIGLACDMQSIPEESHLTEIKELVRKFDAELFIIYVNKKRRSVYATEPENGFVLVHEMLYELRPVFRFLGDIEIDEGLNQFAENHDLDLLIVIPQKHSLMHQLFHKSQAVKIVLNARVPVMSIHE